jgi:preprotein translocase subunit SecD
MIRIARWQVAIILAILVAGVVFAAPNLMANRPGEQLPGWLPDTRVTLGLDLQGGSHLLYEVGIREALEKRLSRTRDDIVERLEDARIATAGIRIDGDVLRVEFLDPRSVDAARDVLRPTLRRDGLEFEILDSGVATIALTRNEAELFQRRLVDQSIEVIRRRVDELGTREATIVRQGEDRILVQVPGVEDPRRLKCIIGKTGVLTFRLVDRLMPAPPADLPVPSAPDACASDAPGSGALL